uniref:basic salivary proline-rich protein 1-like n=1 Tax=Euleptes europaea TaxID=460621 RepID=UPI00253FAF90|nr:basic salivary proline-rich protein 1-like [Euleptes europaea]
MAGDRTEAGQAPLPPLPSPPRGGLAQAALSKQQRLFLGERGAPRPRPPPAGPDGPLPVGPATRRPTARGIFDEQILGPGGCGWARALRSRPPSPPLAPPPPGLSSEQAAPRTPSGPNYPLTRAPSACALPKRPERQPRRPPPWARPQRGGGAEGAGPPGALRSASRRPPRRKEQPQGRPGGAGQRAQRCPRRTRPPAGRQAAPRQAAPAKRPANDQPGPRGPRQRPLTRGRAAAAGRRRAAGGGGRGGLPHLAGGAQRKAGQGAPERTAPQGSCRPGRQAGARRESARRRRHSSAFGRSALARRAPAGSAAGTAAQPRALLLVRGRLPGEGEGGETALGSALPLLATFPGPAGLAGSHTSTRPSANCRSSATSSPPGGKKRAWVRPSGPCSPVRELRHWPPCRSWAGRLGTSPKAPCHKVRPPPASRKPLKREVDPSRPGQASPRLLPGGLEEAARLRGPGLHAQTLGAPGGKQEAGLPGPAAQSGAGCSRNSRPLPFSPKAVYKTAQDVVKDEKALATIVLSVADDQLVHVSGTLKAKAAWDPLSQVYVQKTAGSLIAITRHILSSVASSSQGTKRCRGDANGCQPALGAALARGGGSRHSAWAVQWGCCCEDEEEGGGGEEAVWGLHWAEM